MHNGGEGDLMSSRSHWLLVLAAGLALAACATTSEAGDNDDLSSLFGSPLKGAKLEAAVNAAAAHPLGSERNPVRVNMPVGEHAYLARLRCSDGSAPKFERGGSVGTGPYGTIMDVYRVRCLTGQPAESSVYMDMYHGDYVENRPVPGFSIIPN